MNIVYIEHAQYIIFTKGFTLKAYLAQHSKNYRFPELLPHTIDNSIIFEIDNENR
jgi:hypothetical protein